MPKREDCIDEILKAAGGKRTRTEAESILDQIDEDASRYGRDGASLGEAYAKARDRRLDEEARRAAILRRATRMDAAKAHDIGRFAVAVRNSAKALGLGDKWASMAGEAVLVGLDRPIFDKLSRWGSRRSAEAIGLGFRNKVFTFVERELRDAERADSKMTGLYDELISKSSQDDVFREMWQLDDPQGGKPGITKNARALKIAETLHKAEAMRINALNAEGAWIEDRRNHAFRNSSDPDRMRTAGNTGWFNGQGRNSFTEANRQAWVGDALKRLDTAKMFPGQEADQALASMYGGMVTGDHMEFVGPQDPANIVQNIPKKVSERRVFIFKSADDMLEYNRKYGRFDPTDTWSHSMVEAGRQIGLMKIFGTRPKEGFENFMAALKNETMGTPARLDVDSWDSALRSRYAFVSGEANRPVQGLWRKIANGILAVQRLSKLGLTPFSMLQDNTTVSRELSRQGLKVWERNGSMLTDYFQGSIDSDKQKVAELTYAGLMGDLHSNASRFDTSDAAPGALAKAEQAFFKWTGIQAMTDNKRQSAIRMMARHWGMMRGEDFSALGERERSMMENYGVGDAEWKLLNTVGWHNFEDIGTHLTPDVVDKISDADMGAYLNARGARPELVSAGEGKPVVRAPWSAEALQNARNDLGLSLHSYLADRGNFAVIEVGARERAMLYGIGPGWEPGTLKGEAWRLLMQFKQFPTAMVTRAWMADLRGLKGMGRITGLAELAVSSTLFGIAANFLNGTAKGQDPTAQWRNQPTQALLSGFIRGGAGSMYGDFLLGEWSRFGLPASATLIGPAFGQVDRVAELWTDLTHPSRWKSSSAMLAVRSIRENLPFMNMIYTKMAFDHAIYYRLMEYLSPGYLERYERTMKEKAGQEFWLRPTATSR